MEESTLFWWIWTIFGLTGLLVVPILFVIPAPYGKFTREGWGLALRSDLSWFIQESPSFYVFLITAIYSPIRDTTTLILGLLFLIHYLNRVFFYPLQMRGKAKTTVLTVVISSLFFTVTNGYLQARGLFKFDPTTNSIDSISFWVGVVVWEFGFIMNLQSDQILRDLRKPGDIGYKIPYGGLFGYVSAANYFSETIEHLGWAIACGNKTAWIFVMWTIANLGPRAMSQHKYYLQNFKEYARLNRKAYIPFIF